MSPVYKAEEDEEFYANEPFLHYQLNIHERDAKNMHCDTDSFMNNVYLQHDSEFGLDRYNSPGVASYHFVNENNVYINWENFGWFIGGDWIMDNEEQFPDQKQFTETYFDYENRTFSGVLNFSEPEKTTVLDGLLRMEYTMIFNEDHTAIVDGGINLYDSDGNLNFTISYSSVSSNDALEYRCDAREFEGSVYMRREYSAQESEKFRGLLIKSYKIFLLDMEYRDNVNSVLTSVAEGTMDSTKGLEEISNLTQTYDGQAKMFLDYEISIDDLITLEMITWVRDNFEIDSMIDGIPRGDMSSRLDHVNATIKNEEDTSAKLSMIEHEMMRDHYERQVITEGGPTLTIDGVQAVWSNWQFESVGPTSHLLGGVSSHKDNRLWIGQWMHVSFPNATHTVGNHTITFEWSDEDFTGRETSFNVGLGYGEVFTNVTTTSTNFHMDEHWNDWFSFNSDNGTVGSFQATFAPGYANHPGHDWQEAVDYAATLLYEGQSGHLATITSQEEADLVYSLLDGNSFWLGGFHNLSSPDYSEPSGGWEWITGEEFNHSLWPLEKSGGYCYDEVEQTEWWEWDGNRDETDCDGPGLVWMTEHYLEPNEAGPEDCLEVWGFDKYLNDNRCHMGWMGIVVEYEMNGTNHYEAYSPEWYWDEANQTDILNYVPTTPLTDKERNEILKEEGDPDADNDGIVDAFDDDDDNDGIDDEDDMDDDNDGIDDVNDRCPGTTVDDPVDHEGCSASQIIGEISEDEGLPGFSAILAVSSILGLAILRKPRI